MVRKINCPYCGTIVGVSSHWTTATCPKCSQSFEIGVDVFDLSEEEQKKENELAMKKIHEEEEARKERAIETKRRVREFLHLPEPDPYADIEFEDEDDGKASPESADDKKKKMLIIGGIAGVLLLFVIIFIIMISAAMKKAPAGAVTQTEQKQTVVTQENKSANQKNNPVKQDEATATTEKHDSGWVDGFAIDSNPSDGRYKIDLQSSDSGEQREVQKGNPKDNQKPVNTAQTGTNNTGSAVSENTTSENTGSASAAYSPAAAQDNDSAAMTSGTTSIDDKGILNSLFNGN